jgi:hypothetical protein
MIETSFILKIPKEQVIKFGEVKELNQNSVKAIIAKTLNIYMISNEVNNLKYFVFLIHEQH